MTVRVIFYLLISLFTHPFSKESGLTGFAQGLGTPVSRCAYDSSTLLPFSRIDSFHPLSCCLSTISALNDFASPTASATRHHEHDQAWILADLKRSTQQYTAPRTLPLRKPCTTYFCKDSYSHGFYYVIGLVTLNRPGVHCLPYILHLSSYFPRLSIVLPHNHPSSLNRKGFEGLVRPYDKHEKIRPRKSYNVPTSQLITQRQPTNFTRLRSSTHTRAFSVPVGIATTRGDGATPVTANLAPPLVLVPREPAPPTAVAVAGHGHDRRADDENAAYNGYDSGFLPSFFCAGSAVSPTTQLHLFKPLHNLAGCPRLCTRGMVHRRSRVRTPQFRMQMLILIGIGTTVLLQLPVAALATPTSAAAAPSLDPQRRPTQATHHRSSPRPERSRRTPSKTSNSPCHAHPLFTAHHPVEERDLARNGNGRAGDD